jgi:hypothetical protein
MFSDNLAHFTLHVLTSIQRALQVALNFKIYGELGTIVFLESPQLSEEALSFVLLDSYLS